MRTAIIGHLCRPLVVVQLFAAVSAVSTSAYADEVLLPLKDDQQRSIMALPNALRQCVDVAQFGGNIEICKTVVQFSAQLAASVQAQIDVKTAEPKPKEAAPKK